MAASGRGGAAARKAAGKTRTWFRAPHKPQAAKSPVASARSGSGMLQRAQGIGIIRVLGTALDDARVADHVVQPALLRVEPDHDETDAQDQAAEDLGEVTAEGATQVDP